MLADQNALDAIFADSHSARDALIRLRQTIGRQRTVGLLYGYVFDLRSRARNDAVIVHTGPTSWDENFLKAGGVATDFVARRVDETVRPYRIDLPGAVERMTVNGDPRLGYLKHVVSLGCLTAWIVPVVRCNQRGFGVLNFLMRARHAAAPLAEDDMLNLALAFHTGLKRNGLLANEIGLKPKEVLALESVAIGKGAAEIAICENISQRAVEARMQAARKKLRASNAAEAVYKATAYGILPS